MVSHQREKTIGRDCNAHRVLKFGRIANCVAESGTTASEGGDLPGGQDNFADPLILHLGNERERAVCRDGNPIWFIELR
jgi:hypothetical protein